MIQFKSKKFIILLVIILLLFSVVIFLLLPKSAPVDKIENVNTITNVTTNSKRMMTDSEKEIVGIPKNQKAEVLNDETGFFIYNVIK